MKFKNYIETESGIKDTSNSPGTAGQLLSSTVTGTSWIDQNTISSGSSEVVDIQVKNISSANGGVNLSKGDPVYIYGSVGASARLYVDLADADSTATNNLGDNKMPCVGLLDQDLAPNEEGTATVVGKLRNLITSPIDGLPPNENDTVYVKPGGGLTLTKPAGSANLIQNVGQVGRVSTSSDGNIVVAALLRSNDVPNLPTGRLFVGTATNTSLTSNVVYVDDANGRVGIGTDSPQQKLHVDGSIRVGDTNDVVYADKFFTVSNANLHIGANNGYDTVFFNGPADERMRITSTGKVGIGTTVPNCKLHSATTVSGPLPYTQRAAILGVNDSTDTLYANSIGVAGQVRTYSGRAIYGDAYGAGGWAGYFDGKGYFSGNVGIGITNPGAKLEVNGTIDVNDTGDRVFIADGSDGTFSLGDLDGLSNEAQIVGDANTIKINNGGSTTLTSTFANRIGIGITNPTQKLHVDGNARLTGLFYDGTNSGGTNGQILSSDGGQTEWIDGSAIPGVPAGSGTVNYLARWTPNNDTLGIGVTYDNGTNVGIGTTSPTSQLGSARVLDISSTGNSEIVLDHTDAGVNSDIGLYSWNRSNDHLAHIKASCDGATDSAFISFHAQPTGGSFSGPSSNEKMRIKSNGNVGIGTASPSELLHISSLGPARLLIEADRDNVTETDNAQIILKQDGGNVVGNLGYKTNTNGIEITNQYAAADGILTFGTSGTERMRIDYLGSVGIGTTSPSDKLEVAAANSQLRLRDTDDNNFAQFSYSSGKLVVRNNSTTTTVNQFTLDSIGRIGIGTTSPAEKLHIKSTASSSSSMLYLENAAWAGNMTTGIAFKNGANYLGHTAKIYTIMNGSGNQGGEIRFATLDYSGTNPNPNTTLVDRMTIDDNGNVGIGTSSPDFLFEVEKPTGSGVFTTIANFRAGIDADNTGAQVNVGISNRSWFVRAGRDVGNVAIATMGLNESYGTYNYMTFKSGNVGILTTSPQARLHVANGTLRTWTPSIGTSAIFESTASNRNFLTITATNESEIWFGDATTQAKGRVRYENNNNTMELWTNGSPRININSTGNVGIGTTSPTGAKLQVAVANYSTGCRIDGPAGTTFGFMSFYSGGSYRGNIQPTSSGVIYSSASDYRLKENVVKLQNSTERVKKLKPSNFNFLENPGEIVDGFLAHEIQEVVPEAVTGKKDEVGVDGKPIYQGVDYSKIVPLLTAALQEAISKIEQLETRIQTLENK